MSGGGELTDGILGYAGWEVSSVGPTLSGAAPWVGWYSHPVINIDFTFGGSFNFDGVEVGSTQDNIGDVVLPNLRVFSSQNGTTWNLEGFLTTAPSSANDNAPNSTAAHIFLNVSGLSFTSPYVRVEVSNHPGYGSFSFIDEVRFSGTSVVPEPATWAMMLLGFFGMGALLRNRGRLLPTA